MGGHYMIESQDNHTNVSNYVELPNSGDDENCGCSTTTSVDDIDRCYSTTYVTTTTAYQCKKHATERKEKQEHQRRQDAEKYRLDTAERVARDIEYTANRDKKQTEITNWLKTLRLRRFRSVIALANKKFVASCKIHRKYISLNAGFGYFQVPYEKTGNVYIFK